MKTVPTTRIIIFLVALLFSACMEQDESAYERQVREDNESLEGYLEANAIQAERINGGIYFETLRKNPDGTAIEDESIVAIRYNLQTLNGKALHQLDSAEPAIRFYHAREYPNALIPRGINIGISQMKSGELYRFYVPSYQAFNTYSFGQYLPHNAILVAEVEVEKIETKTAIENEEKQAITDYISSNNLTEVEELPSGIFFQLLKKGTGEKPTTGAQAKVDFKGYYLDGEVFSESEEGKPFTFYVGKNEIIPGFEEGVVTMTKGAKARVFIPSDLAFAEGIQIIPPTVRKDFLEEHNILDRRTFEPVIFEMELLDF